MSKERIKEAAMQQFAQRGYSGTSISQITKQTGMTPPAVYYFFKNKEELYTELVRDCFSHHANHLCGLEEEAQSEHGVSLTRLLERMVDYHQTHPVETAFFKSVVLFTQEEFRPYVQEQFLEHEKRFSELIVSIILKETKDALPPEDREHLVDFCLCVMDGLFVEMFYYEPHVFAVKFERIARMLEKSVQRFK